ncbi:SPOR domain-containing protein [Maricaulis sp.]|uniref:SPOR domain-containing protein n=1 Tax=Maricaulis sp. TaxID=1486257 RepID=UPI0025B87B12|nr:SPOR domain-containing protein [Maricaulis sp.]
MKRLTVFLAALSVCGCATSRPEAMTADHAPAAAIAPTRNAQLAEAMSRELAHLARFDPDAVELVAPELRALANAIVALNDPGDAPDLPVAPVSMDLPPPPADMLDAPSLQHAIHLASYRGLETATRGWAELVVEHGSLLAGLEPRLSRAEIAGQGEYLRLKAGPFDSAGDAQAACARITSSGDYCAVVDFSGRRMADMSAIAGE